MFRASALAAGVGVSLVEKTLATVSTTTGSPLRALTRWRIPYAWSWSNWEVFSAVPVVILYEEATATVTPLSTVVAVARCCSLCSVLKYTCGR